ncbi:hypothetical protein PanWU01x14_200820, partial [Parasponia andersonii]
SHRNNHKYNTNKLSFKLPKFPIIQAIKHIKIDQTLSHYALATPPSSIQTSQTRIALLQSTKGNNNQTAKSSKKPKLNPPLTQHTHKLSSTTTSKHKNLSQIKARISN